MKKLMCGVVGYACFVLAVVACTKDENADPDPAPDCISANAPAVSTSVENAACGTTDGRIQVTATGGRAPFQFSLNATNFQAGSEFSGLSPGNYTITIKDADGCTSTATAQIVSGISYEASIREIISTNCAISGCHVTGGAAPGDFADFSQVKARAALVKSRTANRSMPVGRTLTDAQIQQIACWVDDGALEN
jgi:mono/diheme cytochrome c family protein